MSQNSLHHQAQIEFGRPQDSHGLSVSTGSPVPLVKPIDEQQVGITIGRVMDLLRLVTSPGQVFCHDEI